MFYSREVYTSLIIIILLLITINYIIKLEPFKLESYPCLSRQIKLIKRLAELLWYDRNNVLYEKLQWILQHNNLTSEQLDQIENQLP